MNTPTNGPKNAPQPRPASPAPITPPSRKTRPVAQSLQVMALYAALVPVVCLLVTTCSPATAIAPHSAAGYAGPARESDGQTLAGLDTTGAQPAFIAAFLCVHFAYARAMAGLGGDTREGVPVTCSAGRPTRPSPVTTLQWPQRGRTSDQTTGA